MEVSYYRCLPHDPRLAQHLPWWREASIREPHLVPLDPAFTENLLLAVIAFNGTAEPIGAAAIMEARTKDSEHIFFNGRKVVEIGSNFVEMIYRGNGLGRSFLEMRLEYCLEKNWFPVSVTTNPQVQRMFLHHGGKVMSGTEYSDLIPKLCMCRNSENCNFCPYSENAAWFFDRFT